MDSYHSLHVLDGTLAPGLQQFMFLAHPLALTLE
jgi:hypothetical protein